MDFDKQRWHFYHGLQSKHYQLKIVMNVILGWLILLLSITTNGALAASKMAVFFPSTVSVTHIQKALSVDPTYKDFEVTVYKKFRDFNSVVKNIKPEVIIAPAEFLDYNTSYKGVAQLQMKGKRTFQYDVISIDKKWDASKIKSGSIGVVQVLDRKETKQQIKKIVGNSFKKIKRVTKIEDLFPLLALENANYILISPHAYNAVKDKFRADVTYVLKSKEIGFPIIAIAKDVKLKKLKIIQDKTVKALGFDGIENL